MPLIFPRFPTVSNMSQHVLQLFWVFLPVSHPVRMPVDVRSLHCQCKCVLPLLRMKLTQIILRDRTSRTILCSTLKQPLSSAADLGGYSDGSLLNITP